MIQTSFTEREICEFAGIPYQQSYTISDLCDHSDNFLDNPQYFDIERTGMKVTVISNCEITDSYTATNIANKMQTVAGDLNSLRKAIDDYHEYKIKQGNYSINVGTPETATYVVNHYRVCAHKYFDREKACTMIECSVTDTTSYQSNVLRYPGDEINRSVIERSIRDFIAK